MELSLITFKQVFILFMLIFAGFVIVKAKIVKMEDKKIFSNLLLYLITPMMVINSYMIEFDPEIFGNILLAFGLSAVLMILGFIITFIVTIKMKNENTPIIRFACMYSNAAYMGFPLIQALFGAEGMIYASAFVTVFNILLWTIGYGLISHKVSPKEIAKSVFTNPVLYSVVIGLIIYLGRIPVPDVLVQPVSIIGSMNTPVAMIVTGMIIAGSKIGSIIKNKYIWFIIVVRMLIVPAACLGLFTVFGLNGMAAQVVLLLEACPTAAITSVFAVQFNYEEDLAAGAVVFTTFLSIIILPVCAMILTMIM